MNLSAFANVPATVAPCRRSTIGAHDDRGIRHATHYRDSRDGLVGQVGFPHVIGTSGKRVPQRIDEHPRQVDRSSIELAALVEPREQPEVFTLLIAEHEELPMSVLCAPLRCLRFTPDY